MAAKKTMEAKVTCAFCKKPGHVKDVCWKKKAKAKAKPVKQARNQNIEVFDIDTVNFNVEGEDFDKLINDLTKEICSDKLFTLIAKANNSIV